MSALLESADSVTIGVPFGSKRREGALYSLLDQMVLVDP